MRHVYIYYRVDPTQADAAARAVDAVLNVLAPLCATPPRRLARCDDPALWMETYEGIADFAAFQNALGAAEAKLGDAGIALDTRHRECFFATRDG